MTEAQSQPQSNITDVQRDDPSLKPPQLIADYEAGPDLLRVAVQGMTAEQLRLRPVAGRWSTLEVVGHVCDSEQFFADRMKRTLVMNRPLLVAADPTPVRCHDREIEEELALVELTRRQMARVLKLVPVDEWGRTAVHTEGGLVTLRQLLLHAIRHLKHHVTFIHGKKRAISEPSSVTEKPNGHEVERRGELFVSTDPTLLDVEMIHDFLTNRSYWAGGRTFEVVRRAIDNSLCFGLYEGGRQIGFVRVVTDRATFAWLCDVFVLEEYRGRSLSKWLLECVLKHPALQGLRRLLLGTRDAHRAGSWKSFGNRSRVEAG